MLDPGYLNSLLEDGATRAHGTWAAGHQDIEEFASVASKEYGRIVPEWHVRRGYIKRTPSALILTETPMRGAFKATWAEW
jgi:hypothetical protein